MSDISTAPITGKVKTQTVRIDTNLSGKEYYAVDFDGTDRNVVNLVEDGSSQAFLLTTAGNGSTNETTGVIVLSGRTKAKCGNTVTVGQLLVPDSGGALIPAAVDTEFYCAEALEDGATDDVISVMAIQGTLSAT